MKKLSSSEIGEVILRANPGMYLTFNFELSDWVMVHPTNISIHLVDELGVYTLNPDKTLPMTSGYPNLKQLIIDGKRLCFVLKQ